MGLRNNSLSTLHLLSFWGLEYHLVSLDLSWNQFQQVPVDALRLLRHLKSLSLAANQITILRNNDFIVLKALDELTLDDNPIHLIEPRAFAGVHLSMLNLQRLRLKRGLHHLPTQDLKKLKGLSLSRNHIKKLPEKWAEPLRSLTYLQLDENKIESLDALALFGLEASLRSLSIAKNKLDAIPTAAIQSLTYIETLNLSRNKIVEIPANAFNTSTLLQVNFKLYVTARKICVRSVIAKTKVIHN